MVRCIASLVLVVPALSASAFELVVADARHDALYRMADLDGSGRIESAEVREIYTDESAGPDLSTPADLIVVGELRLQRPHGHRPGGRIDVISNRAVVPWPAEEEGPGVAAGGAAANSLGRAAHMRENCQAHPARTRGSHGKSGSSYQHIQGCDHY